MGEPAHPPPGPAAPVVVPAGDAVAGEVERVEAAAGGGPLVVVSDDAAGWGRVVAARNRGGARTALVVGDPRDPEVLEAASALAAEMLRPAPAEPAAAGSIDPPVK